MDSTRAASTPGRMMEIMGMVILLVSALLLLTPGFWAVVSVLGELAVLLVQTTGKILWGAVRSLGSVCRRNLATPLLVPSVAGQQTSASAPASARPLRSPTRPPQA